MGDRLSCHPRGPRSMKHEPSESRTLKCRAGFTMDNTLRSVFENRLRHGELILFTGAGFSAEAEAICGQTVPVGSELRKALWSFAYPGEPFDDASALGDLYQVAVRQGQNRLGEDLKSRLTIDPSKLPEFYRQWFSIPWRTIYTLNLDDIEQAAQRRFQVPVSIVSVSALNNTPLPLGGRLMCVHLNGKIDEYPRTTFSDAQYGERTALPDSWYRNLVADLSAFSVVFVGTVLDEPPLWQQVAVRSLRDRRSRELRPRSFLVTPTLSRPRQDVLSQLNIDWIPMTAREFAEQILSGMQLASEEGHRYLSSIRSPHPGAGLLRPVAELQAETRDDLAEYLLGRQPSWADITQGFAVRREFENTLAEEIVSTAAQAVIFTGTAGTGKSTTILRAAVTLQVRGSNVQYLDIDTDVSIQRLRTLVRQTPTDYLVIDDADVFGTSAGPLIADLTDENPDLVILAAMRSTRFDALDIASHLKDRRMTIVDVPKLEDADIDRLIDALTRANRLGELRGRTLREQREAFQKKAGRQLLVAMIETTSNRRFEEKVRSECNELTAGEQFVYALVALATRFRQFLRRDEVLIAVGSTMTDAIRDIDSLLRKQILTSGSRAELAVRHRVIADEAMKYFRGMGDYSYVVEGLLFSMAVKAGGPEHSPYTREHRLLVRLLSRQFLLQELSSVQRIREIYASVEEVLEWDFHFWLQRGSLEVDVNNVEGAENFLSQARGLAPDDYRVQTEFAYMQLKKACLLADGGDPSANPLAQGAIADLFDVIWRRGKEDSYPYHVLGSQGLAWSRRGTMSRGDRTTLLNELLEAVREGRRNHPSNRELQVLDSSVYLEYLRSAHA